MKLLLRLNVSGLMTAVLITLLSTLFSEARAMRSSDDEKTPTTAARRSAVLRGRASWYGREHQGHRTSNGERFDRNKYTCAHKTLPFGTRLRVTNPETQKSVVVRVSDRGPFRHQRILDLSEIAARPLGIVQRGAVSVVAEVVPSDTPLGPADAPEDLASLTTDSLNTLTAITSILPGSAEATDVVVVPEPQPTFVVQAGTFGDARNAQAVQDKIKALDSSLVVTVATGSKEGKPLNRVLVGSFQNKAEADKIRLQLQKWGIASLVRQGENM
ncbi:septal ring lytic transglycosylase RlpA family protein [Microvirga sp. STR05]|uniref:Probable endolytic peptidoglycan transglycosylase RlpA n=1 Tax=Hymenobacter duratus TaxID=2771356 RepID=A0ABR8JAT4_9BACT|nr:septal ring lytic transglycosylase RlpA family protein [Hymenobacter duratus]MBD2713722.1 septal ring lytic transglycosylase RlpA family protein [Hymenobacter duratus]MBR7948624.1 septal ring lytic transglycosylase RlpA family protein [Microvirga sp. STR05]